MVSARYRRGEGKKVVTVGMLGFRYSSDAAVGSGEGEDEVEGGAKELRAMTRRRPGGGEVGRGSRRVEEEGRESWREEEEGREIEDDWSTLWRQTLLDWTKLNL